MLTVYHAQPRPRHDTTIRPCPQAVRTIGSTRSSALSHGRPAGLYCMSNGKLCRVPSRLSKHGGRVTEQPRTYCGDRCCNRKIKTHVCPYCSSHSRRFRFILETRLKIYYTHLSICHCAIICIDSALELGVGSVKGDSGATENAGLENAAPDCRGGKRGSSTLEYFYCIIKAELYLPI